MNIRWVFAFAIVLILTASPAYAQKPTSNRIGELEQKVSRVIEELGRFKESVKDSVKADLYPYLTIIVFGGGLAVWVLIYTSLSNSIKDTLTRHLETLVDDARKEINTIRWFGDSERENAIGAFWEELYENPPEGAPRRNAYLDLALDAYERAVGASRKLKKEDYPLHICVYQNNLAHCLSLRIEAGIGSPNDKERALELAGYAVANSEGYPNYSYRFRETEGWVRVRFAGTNQQEREEGKEIIKEVLQRSNIPVGWGNSRKEKYTSYFREAV